MWLFDSGNCDNGCGGLIVVVVLVVVVIVVIVKVVVIVVVVVVIVVIDFQKSVTRKLDLQTSFDSI